LGLDKDIHRITSIAAKDVENNWFGKAGPASQEQFIISSFLGWLYRHDVTNTIIVTHNGTEFDIPYIETRAKILGFACNDTARLHLYEHHDTMLMAKKLYGRYCKLDWLAQKYGCETKCGTGLQAVQLAKEGRYRDLLKYNMQDSKCTEQVYFKLKKELGIETN
jgi:DNA polymerase elongation subunit (family B)